MCESIEKYEYSNVIDPELKHWRLIMLESMPFCMFGILTGLCWQYLKPEGKKISIKEVIIEVELLLNNRRAEIGTFDIQTALQICAGNAKYTEKEDRLQLFCAILNSDHLFAFTTRDYIYLLELMLSSESDKEFLNEYLVSNFIENMEMFSLDNTEMDFTGYDQKRKKMDTIPYSMAQTVRDFYESCIRLIISFRRSDLVIELIDSLIEKSIEVRIISVLQQLFEMHMFNEMKVLLDNPKKYSITEHQIDVYTKKIIACEMHPRVSF
jgi:hypothetical protein